MLKSTRPKSFRYASGTRRHASLVSAAAFRTFVVGEAAVCNNMNVCRVARLPPCGIGPRTRLLNAFSMPRPRISPTVKPHTTFGRELYNQPSRNGSLVRNDTKSRWRRWRRSEPSSATDRTTLLFPSRMRKQTSNSSESGDLWSPTPYRSSRLSFKQG
jgi:hypothetical protein